jgi:hypothetical protein
MKYAKTRGGVLLPQVKIKTLGHYEAQIVRDGKVVDEFEFDNICVNEGLIALLNVGFAGQSIISNWYMGVFTGNYTPVATDTASSIVGNATEFTGYSGGARPSFSPAAAAQPTPSLTNSANRASFTFTGAATLLGAFLISSATPGSSTGTLFSAAQFGSPKTVGNTDQLLLTYTLNAASS